MKLNKKFVMPVYIVLMMLHFLITALMYNYITIYLLDRGFTVTRIGMVLAVVSVLTMLFQPLSASLLNRYHLNWSRSIAVVYIFVAALGLALWLLPLEGPLFVILLTMVLLLQSMMQPLISSLYRGYHNAGVPMSYAVARGAGSAMYSFTTLVVGLFLRTVAPRVLPAFYVIPALLLTVLLWIFHAPNVEEDKQSEQKTGGVSLLRDYPHFILFLFAVAFVSSSHRFNENFMLLIVQRIGGDSSNVGIALAVSSIVELPAMILYKKLFERFGNRRLLLFAAWMWIIKSAAIAFAPHVYVVYAAGLLQFVSYAIYEPAAAKHIAHALPKSEFLRGQTLASSAYVGGSLIASLLGGFLIDRIGITPAIIVLQVISFAGVILFTISIRQSLKAIPSVPRKRG